MGHDAHDLRGLQIMTNHENLRTILRCGKNLG